MKRGFQSNFNLKTRAMSRIILFLLTLLSISQVSYQQKTNTPGKDFTIRQLTPGIWAAIHNDQQGHAICNAGIIDLGNKTIIFDAFINPDAAVELKRQAEQLTHHPVSFVINSHYHDDHIRGNQAFAKDATIISTEWTKNKMQKSEPEEQEWARKNTDRQLKEAKVLLTSATGDAKSEALMWVNYYEAISQSLPTLRTVLPSVTFTDSLWIHGDQHSVLLFEIKNGHTESDIVMLLPAEGIVFMGDLLFSGRHPWLGEGKPESFKNHLKQFYADQRLKQFVPGHGPLSTKKELHELIEYINDLQQLAVQAVKQHIPDSVFLNTQIPYSYLPWWFGRFFKPNLAAVYREASNQ